MTLIAEPPVVHSHHSCPPSPGADPAAKAAPVVARDAARLSLAAIASAASLAACGGGGGGASTTTSGPSSIPASAGGTYKVAQTPEEASRFLQHAQLAASDADIASVRTLGYAGWLQQQFDAPQSQSGWDWLNSRGYDTVDNATRYYDNSYPGDAMIWQQLMTAPDQVRQRMALALSEFFVVSLSSFDFAWRSHAIAAWWDLLTIHAFGNFRDLLEAVTLSPAMGYFLNTKGNLKENTAAGRQPDENYAREVMQLFTIGLYALNADGTEKLDGNGQRIESYTLADVSNLARVFTGWDLDTRQNVNTVEPVQNRTIPNTSSVRLPMILDASRHSALAATFLGTTIAANTEGNKALGLALDALFKHPNVGPFFGKQMIQRLVTSNPSPAYVARVAAAFNDNGRGVRGDLKAVWATILLDDEARGPLGLAHPSFGRLREPMLRLVQWGRSFGIRSAMGSWKIGDLSNPASQLGQSPLRSPTVFNFFRPGYVPPSTTLASNAQVAPELQIVNESSVGGYLNYLQGVVRNGIYVNAPDLPNSASNANNGYDITVPYTAELALVTDPAALVRRATPACHANADRQCDQHQPHYRHQQCQRPAGPRGRSRAACHGLGRLPGPKVRSAMHLLQPAQHSRRAFLRRSGQLALTGTALPFALNLAALGEAAAFNATDYKALVCVFLYGGNDYANTVVPYDDANYNRYSSIRGGGANQTAGGIALAKADLTPALLQPTVPLAGGQQFALNPSMTGLAGLFNAGQAAVQLNVGPLVVPLTRAQFASSDRSTWPLPPKLFSHNDQQSIWQSAAPEGATAGWGGRVGDLALSSNSNSLFSCMSVTGNAVFLSGQQALSYQVGTSGTVAINSVKNNVYGSAAVKSAMANIVQQSRSHLIEDAYNRVTARAVGAEAQVTSGLAGVTLATAFPTGNSLADQLKMVARLIAARSALGAKRQVFMVSIGGFDLHDKLIAQHGPLLGRVSAAMTAFYNATVELGIASQVTAFTASDFGRTLASNGDGSDHGWGSHHLVVGGAVKGAAFYGTPPPVSTGNTTAPEDQWHVGQGRLLPSTSVDQYAATLARWFGVSEAELPSVLPHIRNFGTAAGQPDYPTDLGFMA